MVRASYFPGPSADYEVTRPGNSFIIRKRSTGSVTVSGYDTIRFDDGTFVWDAKQSKIVPEYGTAPNVSPPASTPQADPIVRIHITVEYQSGRMDKLGSMPV